MLVEIRYDFEGDPERLGFLASGMQGESQEDKK